MNEQDTIDAAEIAAERAAMLAEERFYEQGTSAQHMMYQAELDADAGNAPEFSAGYWPA